MNVSPREVNKKQKELIKPINIFCRQNYLDLNYIVDEVVAMSLPYSETRKEKEKIPEDLSVTNFHLNQNKEVKNKRKPESSQNMTNLNKNKNILLISNPFISKATIENYNTFENNKKNEINHNDRKSFTQYSNNNIKKENSQISELTQISKLKSENNFNAWANIDPNLLIKNLNAKSFEQDLSKLNSEFLSKFILY